MPRRKPFIYLVNQGPAPEEGYPVLPPPFGILYVGQALRDAGYGVKLFHLRGGKDRRLFEAVNEERPLFVGFSNFIQGRVKEDIRLSQWVHAQGITVVWGGIFSTSLPEVPLHSGYVDYVVMDEGEKAAVALAEAVESGAKPRGIPGVGYREDGAIILEPPGPPETELDRFRYGWEHFDWKDYILPVDGGRIKFLRIPFSRGCPYKCSFCYNAVNPFRRKWRAHSPEYLREMVSYFKKEYGVNMVSLVSDNPFANLPEAKKRVEALDTAWVSTAHLGVVDADFLDWAKGNRCFNLAFGAESGSDETLRRMKKGFTAEEVRQKILLCGEKGLASESNFVTFSPGETLEDRRKTLRLIHEIWERNPLHRPHHQLYKAYPKTPFWDDCLLLGHQPPTTLEQWAEYRGEIHRLLGYSDRHVLRLHRLVSVLWGREKRINKMVPPILRPWLSRRAEHAAFRGPVEELLHAARIARDAIKGTVKKSAADPGLSAE